MYFNPQPKHKRVLAPWYLEWQREEIGCIITRVPNSGYAHHIIGCGMGLGGTGTKVDDFLTFPLSNPYHLASYETGIHKDVAKWEKEWQPQAHYVQDVINLALNHGVIKQDIWDKYTEICDKIITNFEVK